MGVFPEFRRRGIAYSLVLIVHEILRKYECDYSFVGTPITDHNAIELYKKGRIPVHIRADTIRERTSYLRDLSNFFSKG